MNLEPTNCFHHNSVVSTVFVMQFVHILRVSCIRGCTNGSIGPTSNCPRITSFSLVIENEQSIKLT